MAHCGVAVFFADYYSYGSGRESVAFGIKCVLPGLYVRPAFRDSSVDVCKSCRLCDEYRASAMALVVQS